MTNLELIAYAEQNAQSSTLLTHDQIVQLLSIEPESAEWSALGCLLYTSALQIDRKT